MHDPLLVLTEARRELARLPAIIDAITASTDDGTWRARPAPDEWSPIEIVCHLRDEEIRDFGARLQVILDGGHEFAPIDPSRWVVEARYRETAASEAIGDLRARRDQTLVRLAAVDPVALTHAVDHPRAGRLSGLDLIAAWVAHDRLHLAQLMATLARLWADRWAPLQTEYAGPIPYASTPPA